MRVFNSIQLVVLFAVLPFLISWTSTASFVGAGAANVVCWGAYIGMGIFLTVVLVSADYIWGK